MDFMLAVRGARGQDARPLISKVFQAMGKGNTDLQQDVKVLVERSRRNVKCEFGDFIGTPGSTRRRVSASDT
jgi:hypothetical protein